MRLPLWPYREGSPPGTLVATDVADAWARLVSRTRGEAITIEAFLRDSRALNGGREALACRRLIRWLTDAPYRWHIGFAVDHEAWRCIIKPTPYLHDRWDVGATGSTMEDAFCRAFVRAVKAECQMRAFDDGTTRRNLPCPSP